MPKPLTLAVQVVTLLLHQRRLGEALAQFRAHLGRFRRPAALQGGPPAAAAVHAGWLARQYTAMAELLAARVDPAAVPVTGQVKQGLPEPRLPP